MIGKSNADRVIVAAVCSYVVILIILPIGSIFRQAFMSGVSGFFHSLASPIGVASIRLTVETSLVAAVINTIVGTIVAYTLVRQRIWGATFLNAIVDLPFTIPTTISGLMLILLYQPNSPIGGWFIQHGVKLIYSLTGIVIAMVFITFPFTVRAVQPLLEQLDRTTEDAARTLGAGRMMIFRKLIVPAMMPGIWAGFTLTLNRSLAEFGSVVMVSGNLPMHTQVASVYLYGLLENDDAQGAAAVSVLLLLVSLVAIIYQSYALRRTSKSLRSRTVGWWRKRWRGGRFMALRIGLSSFVYLWFFALLLLPLWGIFHGAFDGGLGAFFAELGKPEAVFSLKMTLVITLLVVFINTIFGVWTALVIAKRSFRGWFILNAIVDIPFAVSPVIAGLSLILVYGPNSWIGGVFADRGIKIMFELPGMVLATLFVTFPFVVRELVPVLRENGIVEQEAAYTLGASRWTTFWRVTIPSVQWAVVYGMILTIGRSLGEFGAVLVVSGNVILLTQTATQYVYQSTVDHNMHAAYAVSVVLAAASFAIVILLELLKTRRGIHRL